MPSPFAIPLRLAGVSFRVEADPLEAPFIEARFGAYRAPAEPDAVRLRIAYAGPAFAQPAGLAFPGARAEVEASGRIVFTRRDEQLTYDPAAREAVFSVARAPHVQAPVALAPTNVDTPLRLLLSVLLVERGGLLLHAAGLGDARSALVFPAHGGGGKTTTASKLPDSLVLSDDQIALTRDGPGWLAHALPFVGQWGKPTRPRSAPLAGLALLAKADVPALRPLRPAEALSRLLGCVVQFLPGGPARRAVDTTAALVTQVPVSELALRLDTPLEPWLARLRP